MTTETKGSWYVIRVAGNKEKSMSEKIRAELKHTKLENKVYNIIVPIEKTFHLKNGKKVSKDTILFPGYVLIETDRISEIKNALKGFPGVAGFIGDRAGNPAALSRAEVDRMVGKLEELEEKSNLEAPFVVGEKVKIIDGPFSTFVGTVMEVDSEKNKLKVDVTIFGRVTPVELQTLQVVKN